MIRNKIIILLGPPGSGKGSLSSLCVERFGWLQLSTGNLCRENIEQETQLGKQIEMYLKQGLLVPDEIIADLVVDWIMSQKQLPEGILFDGYPRTKVQASIFYNLLKTKLSNFDVVLVKFDVDQDLLLQRILNRVICSNKQCGRVYSMSHGQTQSKEAMVCDVCGSALVRRIDDTKESLEQRLKQYFQHEQEIIDFYVDKGFPMCTLNGAQEISVVFNDFNTIVQHNYGC